MIDPLATYFTVESDYPFGEQCGFVCNPTIAPSSIVYYEARSDGIAEWSNSILLPTLKHGVVYVQAMNEEGTAVEGLPVAWLGTQNRYRDLLVSADGKEVYIATDAFGSAAQLYGSDLTTSVLHNPGAILKFTYGGEGGSSLAPLGAGAQSDTTPAGSEAAVGGPEEFENPANLGLAPGVTEQPSRDVDAANSAEDSTASTPTDLTANPSEDLSALVAAGQPKFGSTCAGCHGANGQGGAGAVLANNAKLADPRHVASTIIHGLGYMPPFAQLSDEDVSEIGSYIRNSFGNEFGILTVEEAAAAR
jgi:mono/diheme cytochrome c family protein